MPKTEVSVFHGRGYGTVGRRFIEGFNMLDGVSEELRGISMQCELVKVDENPHPTWAERQRAKKLREERMEVNAQMKQELAAQETRLKKQMEKPEEMKLQQMEETEGVITRSDMRLSYWLKF